MSEVRKQMEQLRDELHENLHAFIGRQQAAQYFVEVYAGDMFTEQFESDEEVDSAVHDYILHLFGEYLVFIPDVATLFAEYAKSGLMMYDEYEGNYIQLTSVKADSLMAELEKLEEIALEERTQQAVATFERFANKQHVVDADDLSNPEVLAHNAYLYAALLYLQATCESTLQEMIYLQQYIQHIEIVYLTPAAQTLLVTYLSTHGYLIGNDESLSLSEKAADFFSDLESTIDNEEVCDFVTQVATFSQV